MVRESSALYLISALSIKVDIRFSIVQTIITIVRCDQNEIDVCGWIVSTAREEGQEDVHRVRLRSWTGSPRPTETTLLPLPDL